MDQSQIARSNLTDLESLEKSPKRKLIDELLK